jgi:N-acetylated-alpha-linked acidic dipeptidase
MAETVNRYIDELDKLAANSAAPKPIDFGPLKSASKSLIESSRRYEETLSKARSKGLDQVKQLKSLNELLYRSERKLTDEQGLPRRPWFRHQVYAPGFYTGYGVKTIPGVREAIEEKLWSEVDPQMKRVAAALQSFSAQVDAATRILEGK